VAELLDPHDFRVRHEQRQQDRGIPGQRQPHPLAQRVDDQVEIARTGADPFGLRAEDVLLEPA